MKFIILILMSLSFNLYAQDCDYRLSLVNSAIEVLDASQVINQPFQIKRSNLGSGSSKCNNYRIFFSKGLSNNYQRRAYTWWAYSLPYNLHKGVNQSGVLKERNDAVTSNEYVEGSSPNRDQTYTGYYFISVPGKATTSIPAGYYYDVVQASVYSINNGFLIFEVTDNVTLLFYVNQTIQVSIVDEGGTFDASSTSKVLDFGYLSQNAEKGADLRVVANGSYVIKVSSQNNGQLKLSSGDLISYSLRVNGSPVNLSGSSGNPVQIGSGDATSNAGDLYNLKVKITESTANKAAGMYQDIVTITAIAN
jgi:hypothetical protein